jgi:hypothetical protein
MPESRAELLARAVEIRDEHRTNRNTPMRVGGALYEIVTAMHLGDRFDVTAYGATGDGVTDDSEAVQDTITAAEEAGGTVIVPPGATYKMDAALTITSGIAFEAHGATLDFSGVPAASSFFTVAGTEGTPVLLNANAAILATSVSVASAAGFSNGDWVRVCSNALYDSADTDSEVGEINKISTVSGTTINLEMPLRGTYNTADGATISAITFVSGVRFSGGTIIGGGTPTATGSDADHTGISAILCNGIQIHDVRFERCDLRGVHLRDCIYAKVTGCHFENFINDNTAYGISFENATQDSIAYGNSFRDCRHSLSTNNSSSSKGIPRRIRFSHNQVTDSATARAGSGGDAIDTHPAAEDIFIDNNSVFRSSGIGINVECSRATIVGNYVASTADMGIYYHNESDYEGEVLIEGNDVRNVTGDAIRVAAPTRGSTALVKSAVILGNKITTCSEIGIDVTNTVDAVKLRGVVISGNEIRGASSATASIYLDDVADATVIGNTITEPGAVAQGCIRVNAASDVVISGNVVHHATSATGHGIRCVGSTDILITGNRVICDTPSNLRGVLLDNDNTNCTVVANHFRGCTTEITRGTGTGHDIPSDVSMSATIASGVITVNRNTRIVTLDTEAAAATDDLDTINGGVAGQTLTLKSAANARDPVIKDGTGNMATLGDFTIATSAQTITLTHNGTSWFENCRSAN